MTTTQRAPRFPIGLSFTYRGKVNTITDILTTTNAAGDVVNIEYVAEHPYIMGTKLTGRFLDTTIARNLPPDVLARFI